jgi:hypothetical protein
VKINKLLLCLLVGPVLVLGACTDGGPLDEQRAAPGDQIPLFSHEGDDGECPPCRDLKDNERHDVQQIIDEIRVGEDLETCEDIKGLLQNWLDDDRIQIYEYDDGYWAWTYSSGDVRSRWWNGHWPNYVNSQLRTTTVHEGAHGLGIGHGSTMEWIEENCIRW